MAKGKSKFCPLCLQFTSPWGGSKEMVTPAGFTHWVHGNCFEKMADLKGAENTFRIECRRRFAFDSFITTFYPNYLDPFHTILSTYHLK